MKNKYKIWIPVTALTFVSLLGFGCSSSSKKHDDVTFAPTENRAVTEDNSTGENISTENNSANGGPAVATYNIPLPASPLGQVSVMSKGIEDVKARDSDTAVSALHLQMTVVNEKGAQPWVVDPRNLIVEIEGDGSLHTTLVNTPGEVLPLINVVPGETQTIDLYFVLPDDYKTAMRIPGFTFKWQVRTDHEQLVAENTPFAQITAFGKRISVYPFDQSPLNTEWNRVPQSVGPDIDWWADPFSNLPFPWYDLVY